MDEDEAPPAAKRARVMPRQQHQETDPAGDQQGEQDQEEQLIDDDTLLLQVLEGDAFVAEEERERRAAEQRRLQRQERLKELRQRRAEADDDDDDDAATTNKTTTKEQRPAAAAAEEDTKPAAAPALNGVIQKPTNEASKVAASSTRQGLTGATADAEDADKSDDDDDDDEFDMFSSSVSPTDNSNQKKNTNSASSTAQQQQQQQQQQAQRGAEQQDWDDAEGYYKAVIGETIHLDPTSTATTNEDAGSSSNSNNNSSSITFRVAGVIGKGVFSTVLKCTTISNSSSVELPPVTALKFIRHNETMARAALTEIEMLQRLHGSPGIVPMLLPTHQTAPLEHRGHTILVFSFMEYNLRDVLQKFGKGVGLSLQAVRSYFGQLLAAATHLKKHGIVHCDIKPDNILVSADFSIVQVADFGSAVDADAPNFLSPCPYLVSRFYRAPELILGLTPVTHAVDLWSLAVSVAELFLGDVLFRGTSNNDMLYVFQQHLGACSNRVIRQHLVQCQKFLVASHFQQKGAAYYFMQQTADPVTGAPVHKELSLLSHERSNSNHNKFPLATPLHNKLVKAKSAKDSRRMVKLFSDLLKQCLVLDPTKRIALKEALRHEFFQPQTGDGK